MSAAEMMERCLAEMRSEELEHDKWLEDYEAQDPGYNTAVDDAWNRAHGFENLCSDYRGNRTFSAYDKMYR